MAGIIKGIFADWGASSRRPSFADVATVEEVGKAYLMWRNVLQKETAASEMRCLIPYTGHTWTSGTKEIAD